MDTLYIALLVRKKKLENHCYICEGVGPIVGLLMGNHFLSSHSKHYLPMISKNCLFQDGYYYLNDYQDCFFQSNQEYGYYEIKKVEDYSLLDEMIDEYKKKFDKVCYFADFGRTTPIVMRYKKL